MVKTIRSTERKARKIYECNASLWLQGCLDDIRPELTPEETAAVATAQDEKWQILPGQKYFELIIVQDGVIMRTRVRPDIQAICLAHKVYVD